jgi:hypothetical protein
LDAIDAGLDSLDLRHQPRTQTSGKRRIPIAVVGDDRVEILLNPGMEDQTTSGHFQRAPIRASSSSQVNPIDGSRL